MVVAGDAHFDKFAVEPEHCNCHEQCNAACDIEEPVVECVDPPDIAGMIIVIDRNGMSKTHQKCNIGDVICDGIEPFALVAWRHAHSGQFAVDAVDDG